MKKKKKKSMWQVATVVVVVVLWCRRTRPNARRSVRLEPPPGKFLPYASDAAPRRLCGLLEGLLDSNDDENFVVEEPSENGGPTEEEN